VVCTPVYLRAFVINELTYCKSTYTSHFNTNYLATILGKPQAGNGSHTAQTELHHRETLLNDDAGKPTADKYTTYCKN